VTDPNRTVKGHVSVVVSQPADLVLSLAAATDVDLREEEVRVTLDGAPLEWTEIEAPGRTRLHRVSGVGPGLFVLDYAATVGGGARPREVDELEVIEFTRPSRYCDSDRLAAVAATHFSGLEGWDLVQAVRRWVLENITYAPGSSDVVDGALEAYLSRRGVCRDSAQLVITFLRAMGVPARLVSVYAPGLSPMDFHAVAEVAVDGRWWVVDGTGLAPRASMVRIATGRDAADTAFLTVLSGRANLSAVRAEANAVPLPDDDGETPTQLT
jgi:transglutaminase-like putative cysteine protease